MQRTGQQRPFAVLLGQPLIQDLIQKKKVNAHKIKK
jgi:hypothetical protein